MKKLVGLAILDIALIISSVLIFKEHSFLFCGIGIIFLGFILFKYYNYKK